MPLFARIPIAARIAAIRLTGEKPLRTSVLDAMAAVKGVVGSI